MFLTLLPDRFVFPSHSSLEAFFEMSTDLPNLDTHSANKEHDVYVMIPMSPLSPVYDPNSSNSPAYVTTTDGRMKFSNVSMESLKHTDVQIEVLFASLCDRGLESL